MLQGHHEHDRVERPQQPQEQRIPARVHHVRRDVNRAPQVVVGVQPEQHGGLETDHRDQPWQHRGAQSAREYPVPPYQAGQPGPGRAPPAPDRRCPRLVAARPAPVPSAPGPASLTVVTDLLDLLRPPQRRRRQRRTGPTVPVSRVSTGRASSACGRVSRPGNHSDAAPCWPRVRYRCMVQTRNLPDDPGEGRTMTGAEEEIPAQQPSSQATRPDEERPQDRPTGGAPAPAATAESPRERARLAFASFLMLFVELALIRWVGATTSSSTAPPTSSCWRASSASGSGSLTPGATGLPALGPGGAAGADRLRPRLPGHPRSAE